MTLDKAFFKRLGLAGLSVFGFGYVAAYEAPPVDGGAAIGSLSGYELERIIQPIITVNTYRNGVRELSVGSGFIIGDQYLTVAHNLGSDLDAATVMRRSTVDGVAVTPAYAHRQQDVALFDLPDELCRRHCNQIRIAAAPRIAVGQRVVWMRKFADERVVKEGRVLNFALLGDQEDPAFRCDANLIIEVDQPFVEGSSGGPVLDADSGQIIGVIQGSLERDGVRTGYFKPIDCFPALAARSE